MKKSIDELLTNIMYLIVNKCEECPSNTSCPEEDCVLFNIEKEIVGYER